MSSRTGLVVVTDVAPDADVVCRLLADEYGAARVSADPEDFDRNLDPEQALVLILAFRSLEEAERYYLGLYRRSTLIHTLPHRTIVLCAADEVREVYALCKKNYFDDYVLFWPLSHEARLPMSVHLAMRALAELQSAAQLHRVSAQARRVGEIGPALEAQIAAGGTYAENARRSMQQAQAGVGDALDRFSARMLGGAFDDAPGVHNPDKLRREIGRVNAEDVQPILRGATEAAQPIQQWMGALMSEVAPQLEAAREIAEIAREVLPIVLIVDDDEFQRKIIARILSGERYEILQAGSGADAFAALRRCRPDLILMDIQLPGTDGISVTRLLNSTQRYRDIPVIMVTGHSGKQVLIDSRAAGAVDFIVKPLDRETLLKKVAKYLAR